MEHLRRKPEDNQRCLNLSCVRGLEQIMAMGYYKNSTDKEQKWTSGTHPSSSKKLSLPQKHEFPLKAVFVDDVRNK